MSSLAQEESRSISENVTWGWRKRIADGKVSVPYGRFLGYEKDEDGNMRIVESEARIVRQDLWHVSGRANAVQHRRLLDPVRNSHAVRQDEVAG